MDIYEFSERDDQTFSQSKLINQKKRKSKNISILKNNKTSKKGRKKRNKSIIINKKNVEKIIELNPPIKLKLIRDENNPQIFKSIQLLKNISQKSNFSFDLNHQSLIRCKLFDGKEFQLNDIVWAKISGYPFWPSKILSINFSHQKSFNKNSLYSSSSSLPLKLDLNEDYIACVEWLAYDQISYVNCINLSHFQSDYFNKYNGKIKNKKYFEAVNEAKNFIEENLRHRYDYIGNQQTIDSVNSYETTEADTSSTLPSHNFTSPESNQSVQSYCNRISGARSNPLSNQSDRSLYSNTDYPPNVPNDLLNAHNIIKNDNNSAINFLNNWELPDLGSNLDFENNNHIPQFSDDEDDCENIDIAKIEFIIDETHNIKNT